jgi:hypothetical protein
VGCVLDAPAKHVIKKAGQYLNDLSSCLRFRKQSILRQSLGTFELLTTQPSSDRFNQRLI